MRPPSFNFHSAAVTLPPRQQIPPPPPRLKAGPNPNAPKRGDEACVLVVDDDPNILLTVRSILEFEGYRVETASNGEEGVTKALHLQPDLILLDMRMPILDGWGFATRLREAGGEIPMVVITAARDASDWAAEIGAVGHLDKPFDLIDLLDMVERWCAKP